MMSQFSKSIGTLHGHWLSNVWNITCLLMRISGGGGKYHIVHGRSLQSKPASPRPAFFRKSEGHCPPSSLRKAAFSVHGASPMARLFSSCCRLVVALCAPRNRAIWAKLLPLNNILRRENVLPSSPGPHGPIVPFLFTLQLGFDLYLV